MLALMTPGFLLGLGTQLLWKAMGVHTDMWQTALGANSVWGIPFGFLVMLAVWNRYDEHIEEAARDLGANLAQTFREVTLPLVWTGIFGAALFGFTLTWNDFDRTVLLVLDNTLPLQIVGLIQASAIRPDLYALGTATTLVTLFLIFSVLVVVTVRLRLRGRRVQLLEARPLVGQRARELEPGEAAFPDQDLAESPATLSLLFEGDVELL